MTIGISHSEPAQAAKHTLLYVFSPSKQERLYQIQMDTLTDRQIALNDHDVVIAEIFEHETGHLGSEEIRIENEQGLRREYHIAPGQFKVVLVGKDSAVKLCAESCISCEEVIMRVENEHIHEAEFRVF
ncbi:MAG: DUF4174 domain-containing protein [Planctomycetota bacterium]